MLQILINRYCNGLSRRFQRWQCQCAYNRSPKPLEDKGKVYATLFFDYEGRWGHQGQEQNSRKGVEYVLETLNKANLKATFNCVGRLFEDEPDIFRTIVADNHEIASHTFAHTRIERWRPDEVKKDIEKLRQILAGLTTSIVGFRSPESKWSRNTLKGLLQSNILWNAENDPAPMPYVIAHHGRQRLWRMPTLLDDWDMEATRVAPQDMRCRWESAVSRALESGRYVAIGFHPWVLGKEQSRLTAFSDFIDFIKKQDKLTILPFGRIADLCEESLVQ